MKLSGPINDSMLVADIQQQYPQCVEVFEKYRPTCCSGCQDRSESLSEFADVHHLALSSLLEDLNKAVRGECEKKGGSVATDIRFTADKKSEEAADKIYRKFVTAAILIALTFGFTLGVINLTRISFAQSFDAINGVLKQIHAHAQIFGWVSLFIMGVTFHITPRLKMKAVRPVWAMTLSFGFMVTGVVLRALSQPLAMNHFWAVVMVSSAVFELCGVGLFVAIIGRSFLRSELRREYYEKFIWACLGWFLVLAIWNVRLTVEMFQRSVVGIPALAWAIFIHIAFFGFIANMIFGFSLRILPHFLGLQLPKVWAANLVFVLWNVAIIIRYPIEWRARTASVLELVAVVLFLWTLGVFSRRRVNVDIPGVDRSFAWFIYSGYAWLLIAMVLPFHHDIFRLSPSLRHAIAVGFVTNMILGLGHRVVPMFHGVTLHSTKLMKVTFWHLMGGSTIVLAMAFNRAYDWPWTYAWVAVSGYLVLAAVIMFSWNIIKTLRKKAEQFTRESVVKRGTRVVDLLEVWPNLRQLLIQSGLSGLAKMKVPPRFVTIELASRRHGIEPAPLIEVLNVEIQTMQQNEYDENCLEILHS